MKKEKTLGSSEDADMSMVKARLNVKISRLCTPLEP